jgi:hypothetical protein
MAVGTHKASNVDYIFSLKDPASRAIVRFVSEQLHIYLSNSEDFIYIHGGWAWGITAQGPALVNTLTDSQD